MLTQTVSCQLQFNGGSLQPSSSQSITLTKCPIAGSFKIFDTSLGGHIIIPKSCIAVPQWWGVVADGDTNSTTAGTDNSTNFNEALAYARYLNIPAGIYRFGSQLTSGISGQKINGTGAQGDNPTILLFSGTSHGIDVNPVSQNFLGNIVSNLQIAVPNNNTSGQSALIMDTNSPYICEGFIIDNVYITGYGTGTWLNGIRIRAAQTGSITNSRMYSAVTGIGLALGDGSGIVTNILTQNNLIGVLGSASAVPYSLSEAVDIVSIKDYLQGVYTGPLMAVDNTSIINIYGLILDNPGGSGPGIDSKGNIAVAGMFTSGDYTDQILCEGFSCVLSNLILEGRASDAMVKFHQALGLNTVGSLSSSEIRNEHATGMGVWISAAPTTTIDGGTQIFTVGGTPLNVDSAGSISNVYANASGSTTFGLTCANNTTDKGIHVKGLRLDVQDLAHTITGCSSNGLNYEMNDITYTASGARSTLIRIPNGQAISTITITGGGAAQTVALTGSLVKIVGNNTDTISTITIPVTGSGCIDIVPRGGGSGNWAFAAGGNIANGASRSVSGNVTLRICNDGSAWY